MARGRCIAVTAVTAAALRGCRGLSSSDVYPCRRVLLLKLPEESVGSAKLVLLRLNGGDDVEHVALKYKGHLGVAVGLQCAFVL